MYALIRRFVNLEAASSIILMMFTMLALLIANSPFDSFYEKLFHTPIIFREPLDFWINDGLMVIFFFLMGLEIKRECKEGHLSQARQRALPLIATLGGVVVPACIYILFNYQDPLNMRGWAIPTATDIAFALGALAIFGKKLPQALRIFLLTVAVLDDLTAVIIIAVFYAKEISVVYLVLAGFVFLGLINMHKMRSKNIMGYIFLSILLWFLVLNSGVHPTVAGVLAAFCIPMGLLKVFEKALLPYVAYGIVPLFAFANAGFSFKDFSFSVLLDPLPMGIMLGLFIGKQCGIFMATWLTVKLRLAGLPHEVSWLQIYGVAVLCGIGFTMSLFMGTLAFSDARIAYGHLLRLSILLASLCSFIWGYIILRQSRGRV